MSRSLPNPHPTWSLIWIQFFISFFVVVVAPHTLLVSFLHDCFFMVSYAGLLQLPLSFKSDRSQCLDILSVNLMDLNTICVSHMHPHPQPTTVPFLWTPDLQISNWHLHWNVQWPSQSHHIQNYSHFTQKTSSEFNSKFISPLFRKTCLVTPLYISLFFLPYSIHKFFDGALPSKQIQIFTYDHLHHGPSDHHLWTRLLLSPPNRSPGFHPSLLSNNSPRDSVKHNYITLLLKTFDTSLFSISILNNAPIFSLF